MTSRRDGHPPRRTHLEELRKKHTRRYDAVDGEHWGCICDDVNCLFIIVIEALNKSEQEVIRVLKDLKNEDAAHVKEIRKLASTIAGLESYNRTLKRENDELQQRLDNKVS